MIVLIYRAQSCIHKVLYPSVQCSDVVDLMSGRDQLICDQC